MGHGTRYFLHIAAFVSRKAHIHSMDRRQLAVTGMASGWVSSGEGILEFDKCAALNPNEMQWNIRCTEKISTHQKVKKNTLSFS